MASIHFYQSPTNAAFPITMLPLCQIDDIPENSSKGYVLAPEGQLNEKQENKNMAEATVFVIRKEDDFFVYQNRCPHLGLPLEWMPDQFLDREGQYIQCATHGALFRIHDGYCVSGPCPGESLTLVPFRIEGKSIIIDNSHLE